MRYLLVSICIIVIYFVFFYTTNNFVYEVTLNKEQSEELQKIYFDIQNILEILHIPFIAYAGTLLGLGRHQKIIPWDDDIDILIRNNNLQHLLRNRSFLNSHGYDIVKFLDFYKIFKIRNAKLPYRNFSWPFIDVFTYKENNDTIELWLGWKKKQIPKKWMYPLKKYPFYDSYAWGPNELNKCLKYFFGDNYKNDCLVVTPHETYPTLRFFGFVIPKKRMYNCNNI